VLNKGKISINRNIRTSFSLENINDERARGKPKIHKASEKDDPAGTFPVVEGFQKPVESD
jgi:hypothetical protein